MDHKRINKQLFDFINSTPNSFFAVKNAAELLIKDGYTELFEDERWKLAAGEKYFVTRNNSTLVAFRLSERKDAAFNIIASHGDSPSFKLKPNADGKSDGAYVRLNVEKYGGMIMSSWLDRPLSVAGRVILRRNGRLEERLVNIDRNLLLIPNLAIHMNREINKGFEYNPQIDMLPLFGEENNGSFISLLAEETGVEPSEIVDYEMFLYNRDKAVYFGAQNEFISAPRLDDLMCAFTTLKGLLLAKKVENHAVYYLADNEEVGSMTKQGAGAGFLRDVLCRINLFLGGDEEELMVRLAKSYMVSADNGHAFHPAHPEKSDPTNKVVLNGGIVIKYNGAQKYATDAVSAAKLIELMDETGIPYQCLVNRSDVAGGSTLGSIANTQAAIRTVDIGLPQLAMHSANETAGARDSAWMVELAKRVYEA